MGIVNFPLLGSQIRKWQYEDRSYSVGEGTNERRYMVFCKYMLLTVVQVENITEFQRD
jgi:hypothetical protein